MKTKYPHRYKLTEKAISKLYPNTDENGKLLVDEFGVELPNYNLRYCYCEPDKAMNGEYWLMDENGIVNPWKYTAQLNDEDIED